MKFHKSKKVEEQTGGVRLDNSFIVSVPSHNNPTKDLRRGEQFGAKQKFTPKFSLSSLKEKLTHNRSFVKKLLLGVGVGIVIVVLLLILNFRNLNVSVNKLAYLNNQEIEGDIKGYLNDKPFFLFSQKDLKDYMLQKYPAIEDMYISKSFLLGLVVEVKEYEPILIIKTTEGNQYFLTANKAIIPYDPKVTKPLKTMTYDNKIETLHDKIEYVDKSVQFVEKLNTIGISGDYSFDLFGNLSILTLDSKRVRVDLKEKYYSVDEQVKILDSSMKTQDYKESNLIDLRFNYLLVKKVP